MVSLQTLQLAQVSKLTALQERQEDHMNVHELHPVPGSTKKRKRVGRGIAAGQGKTAGRGQKGQFSRSGASLPAGFEGGQMPLIQRLPKRRGFVNHWRTRFEIVNVSKLNRFEAGATVDSLALAEAGVIKHPEWPLRILGAGVLRVKLDVKATYVTGAARKQIEELGGTVDILPMPGSSEAEGVETAE